MPEPLRASLAIDPAAPVADVDPRLFGAFVEHLGRCVYTGVYEPGHPTADSDGLRTDVLDLITELGPTMLRYPGGNFVSGYDWEDGVGPKESRPRRLDLAWRTIETNQFGLAEFMRLCRATGTEPMMALNLGTRGLAEAIGLVEYSNFPGGTARSDLRKAHGDADPYGIRLWCLGNELDGPWQIGRLSADEYGRLADRTARALKQLDPALELVACGSSGRAMPTFGEWEATVLEHTYESVEFISAHAYYEETDGDVDSFLASAADMESFIAGTVATADAVGAKLKSPKRIAISFDEWNVWYSSTWHREGVEAEPWQVAPRQLEDVYSVTDAVVVGSLLITLLRNAERVRAACLAQLVNVIAPIMTEPSGPSWRQTIFHPFAEASRYGRGRILHAVADGPAHDTAKHGTVPLLHSVAVAGDDGSTTVFAVNRDTSRPMNLRIDTRGPVGQVSCTTLADPDRHARNTRGEPDRVAPRENKDIAITDGGVDVLLPPLSWNTVRIAAA
ncbi:arabinosylfuranosidase ArfA [Phytomonospora endophytica]|uniref:non-reducing end alpha-L-arabinofuranosidase n=1 Tax=Phytomonospora endophytica TaxID=714109 RepID=A0A841FHX0_9ACTN|nr:alpha-N-arabinofuranosidase [Phytomonospora endophytica]MBB6036941.1 alpha-N-arabinofuranosidase [Phytomonospora endophytica]GIG68028.1 alpha-N-arabinofuranosidase [Phytomonospora endophytica]